MSDTGELDVMPALSCDEVRELAGAYVLGALESDEASAVRAHLASCTDPHEEIATLGGVVPLLAEVVPMIEPPAGLKARIMAAAAADLAARTAEGPAVDPAAATVSAMTATVDLSPPPATPGGESFSPTELSVPTADQRVARRAPGSLRTTSGGWILRIAAVLAIVVLGAWNVLLQGQLSNAKSYEESVAAVLVVAAQPGSITAVLTPDGGTGSGLAAVSSSGTVTLAMQDLAPTTGDTVYEAWIVGGDGVPVPIGSFKVGATGTAYFEGRGLHVTDEIILALTLEPGPDATTPTMPIISKGKATTAG